MLSVICKPWMLSDVMLNVVMMNVVMVSVVAPSTMNDVMLNVIMLNVVILSVVAPSTNNDNVNPVPFRLHVRFQVRFFLFQTPTATLRRTATQTRRATSWQSYKTFYSQLSRQMSGATTLSITTFSIVPVSIIDINVTHIINDTQCHNTWHIHWMSWCWVLLFICFMLSVIMPSVVMLSVVAPNEFLGRLNILTSCLLLRSGAYPGACTINILQS
jgi:hypothetical protein